MRELLPNALIAGGAPVAYWPAMAERDRWNALRYDGSRKGHYESYFQRANHPTEPRAFWIRYTVFVPRQRHELAVGELYRKVPFKDFAG